MRVPPWPGLFTKLLLRRHISDDYTFELYALSGGGTLDVLGSMTTVAVLEVPEPRCAPGKQQQWVKVERNDSPPEMPAHEFFPLRQRRL